MGFINDTLRSGVKTLDALTKTGGIHAAVTHAAWIGQDGAGADLFAPPVNRLALVDRTRKPLYTASGKLIITMATVIFLAPIPDTTPNVNQQRVNPIDPRDVITLDDGVTAPIVKAGGFEDPGKLTPFVNEVVLGNV